jgi:hypothetical protein
MNHKKFIINCAQIMMAEWVLANLMHLDVKAVYVTIRYVFDFTFPLGTLPAMAIMGTATPRCRDTFFKWAGEFIIYLGFKC